MEMIQTTAEWSHEHEDIEEPSKAAPEDDDQEASKGAHEATEEERNRGAGEDILEKMKRELRFEVENDDPVLLQIRDTLNHWDEESH